MGQGGGLWLNNYTTYTWMLGPVHSYQMNAWDDSFKRYPQIAASSSAKLYIEWDQGMFTHENDDAGEATYILSGTPWSFIVQARAKNGFTLQVDLRDMSTQANRMVSLGWVHNGDVSFSGDNRQFWPMTTWMEANLDILGPRPLRHICLPGSHSAGMYKLIGGTARASPDLVLTQWNSIGNQLALGIRYFDLHPVITGDHFSTGHYSNLGGFIGWQGGNGESFKNIISDINAFTTLNKELIILKLSHDLNTDVGHDNYRPFNQDEWNRLINDLTALRHLFITPNPSSVILADMAVSQFIGSAQAAVIVLVEPSGVTLGSYANKGFYKYSQFDLYDFYTDTDNTSKMVNDQIQKMHSVRTSPNSRPFLLSWTMTQQGLGPCARRLSVQANRLLYRKLLPACTPSSYPNILSIDAVKTSDIAVLAMEINQLVSRDAELYTAKIPILGTAIAGLATDNLAAIPSVTMGVVEEARAADTAVDSELPITIKQTN